MSQSINLAPITFVNYFVLTGRIEIAYSPAFFVVCLSVHCQSMGYVITRNYIDIADSLRLCVSVCLSVCLPVSRSLLLLLSFFLSFLSREAASTSVCYYRAGDELSQLHPLIQSKHWGDVNEVPSVCIRVQKDHIDLLYLFHRWLRHMVAYFNFFPTGPVGVSVLTVKTDPFAVAYIKQYRVANKCPALLTPGTFQSHMDTT